MAKRWGNSENSDRLFLQGSKVTADGDCSHEIKRPFLLGRKAMTNLDSMLKSRDITDKVAGYKINTKKYLAFKLEDQE